MKLYHFTKTENVEKIKRYGLATSSNYKTLNSKRREHVLYCWLQPEHDLMGFKNSSSYSLLELEANIDDCIVTNMDWISSAYVNKMVNGNTENELFNCLIKKYDEEAIEVLNYSYGNYRAPEVLVNKLIKPENIKILENTVYKSNKNIEAYYYNLRVKFNNNNLKSNEEINDFIKMFGYEKVAVHDDSTGLLLTLRNKSSSDVVTLNINKESNGIFLTEFFGA